MTYPFPSPPNTPNTCLGETRSWGPAPWPCTLALVWVKVHTHMLGSQEKHHGALPALGTASPGTRVPPMEGEGSIASSHTHITAVSWSHLGEQPRTASADQPLIARSPVTSGCLITQMDFLAFN